MGIVQEGLKVPAKVVGAATDLLIGKKPADDKVVTAVTNYIRAVDKGNLISMKEISRGLQDVGPSDLSQQAKSRIRAEVDTATKTVFAKYAKEGSYHPMNREIQLFRGHVRRLTS
ncbi:hypothetical protein LZC95_51330 [Pendulispora brunnea]|uniref:Uncharacterized protein n=1 Tax=Pendulispora brunnea TaxID=2905690 RepID=A0ABZ2K7Z3_9BACT